MKGSPFQGLVLDGNDLYLTTIDQQRLKDGRLVSVVQSMIVDRTVMDMIASGLGRVQLFQTVRGGEPDPSRATADPQKTESLRARARDRVTATRNSSIGGGADPVKVNLADVQVYFVSTIGVIDWDTGESDDIAIRVASRPSQLYNQLFGASLGSSVTSAIRIGLIVLCVLFALIELLALWMAIRLSRTITASVADLYDATQHIDRGDLNYRIGVTRTDQLAELSRSFNTMTGSLQKLLVEQKEKERLQNEISIAQEVQANLFPRRSRGLPSLELHGVCRPARSVCGDYYDFLVFHESATTASPARKETGVGIAIGDISGKGISAALLMATLHSAVRAYRFASEELVFGESSAGLLASPRRARTRLRRALPIARPHPLPAQPAPLPQHAAGEVRDPVPRALRRRRSSPTRTQASFRPSSCARRQRTPPRSWRHRRRSHGWHALRRGQLPHAARRHPRRLLRRRHRTGERLRRVRRGAPDGGRQPLPRPAPACHLQPGHAGARRLDRRRRAARRHHSGAGTASLIRPAPTLRTIC